MAEQIRMKQLINQNTVRINKFLADAGLCSRRKADELIKKGEIFLNGRKARLGDTVGQDDSVTWKGKKVNPVLKKIYVAFHKPFGVITSMDPRAENSVMDYMKEVKGRVFPIGRLDVESSGLLILTNDGNFAQTIIRAENKIEKEYMVNVDKPLAESALKKLERGLFLENRKTLPAKVKKISPKQFSITIIQGMNRQIRRMCETLGYQVTMLKRLRIGPVRLDDLPRGKWRFLTPEEVASLGKQFADRTGLR